MSISTSARPVTKDYSYGSGERQTATAVQDIRADHSSRYQLAIAVLEQHFAGLVRSLVGLDMFCGNGYGAYLASKVLNAHVLGIDGSAEAIQAANEHYSTSRTVYAHKCFPFEIARETYDFITCFESLEHVEQWSTLLNSLVDALKPGGVLFVSTPNEAVMPFGLNAQWFRHHVRHFTKDDMTAFADARSDLKLAGHFGQRVYRLDNAGRVLSIDQSLDMLPTTETEHAQFLISVYVKSADAESASNKTASSQKTGSVETDGCDAFAPGIIDSTLLQRSEICLDVGCGEAGPQPGFVGVDIRPLRGIGILSQAWTLERYLPPGSVTAFHSRHTLEHLTFPQVRNTLESWFRLLRAGGRVHIIVPDLTFHIGQFLDPNFQAPSPANGKWTQRQHALAGFYGWQREADHKLWDVHKSGHTVELIGELLRAAGFCRFSRLPNKPWHLDVEAYKPS